MKLVVDNDGAVRAVYNDTLTALNLGPMEVKRASNVEFNEANQEWEARTPDGDLIAHGVSRDAVIQQEIKVIESRL